MAPFSRAAFGLEYQSTDWVFWYFVAVQYLDQFPTFHSIIVKNCSYLIIEICIRSKLDSLNPVLPYCHAAISGLLCPPAARHDKQAHVLYSNHHALPFLWYRFLFFFGGSEVQNADSLAFVQFLQ